MLKRREDPKNFIVNKLLFKLNFVYNLIGAIFLYNIFFIFIFKTIFLFY